MKFRATFLLPLLILFSSCSDLFEYSPHDTDVRSLGLNLISAAKISQKPQSETDTLKIVVFTDTHEEYNDLSDAIVSINALTDIDFAICLGDVTVFGYVHEFQWYLDVIEKLRYPLLTVIGNHDYLSNGFTVYKRLFGDPNMSVITGKYKFILFDDVIWENNNRSPRYEWLRDELSDDTYLNIVAAHIPPFTGEIGDLHRMVYNQIVNGNSTFMTMYGQFHFYNLEPYNGINNTLNVASIDKREYCLIELINDTAIVKRIKF
jgi:3',5'-cyclic-AMP phosphodiesterase